MISTVLHTLCRIALRRPSGSAAAMRALGAPERCGEPVRASWLWAGPSVGFSELFSSLSHASVLANLGLDTPDVTTLASNGSGNGDNDLGNHTSPILGGLGGSEPAYLAASIQSRPMGKTTGRIQRIIQSGQRRTILALS
jgi:hypothetical protein